MVGPRQQVRFGEAPPGVPVRYVVIGGAAVLLVLIVVVVIVVGLGSDDAATDDRGCRRDDECGNNRICVAGGCLPLLASEHRGLWHDDVRAQLDAGVGWTPKKRFGVKLMPSSKCPATVQQVATPPTGRTTVTSKMEVYEFGPKSITRHQQVSAKGAVWIDAVRMRFPPVKTLSAADICASDSAVGVAVSRDGDGPYVDVALRNAAPAGKETSVAIAVKSAAPALDAEGYATFSLSLAPVYENTDTCRTMIALPLGADVATIEGAEPEEQRLLTGFVAYYFAHTATPQTVRVRYRIAGTPPRALDVSQVSP